MKIRIERPSGDVLSVDGRTRDVAELVNTWWSATESEPPKPKTTGFQPEER